MTELSKITRTASLQLGNRRAEEIVVTLDAHPLPRIIFRPKGRRQEYSLPLSSVYTIAVERNGRARAQETRRRRNFQRGLLAVSRGSA